MEHSHVSPAGPARLAAIAIYPPENESGLFPDQVPLSAGLGLPGDRHEGDGPRAISLLCKPYTGSVSPSEGFCGEKFRPNFSFIGLDPAMLSPGLHFTIGTCLLSVTAGPKACYADCPKIVSGHPCPLAGRIFFAQVIQPGQVALGDRILPQQSRQL